METLFSSAPLALIMRSGVHLENYDRSDPTSSHSIAVSNSPIDKITADRGDEMNGRNKTEKLPG